MVNVSFLAFASTEVTLLAQNAPRNAVYNLSSCPKQCLQALIADNDIAYRNNYRVHATP